MTEEDVKEFECKVCPTCGSCSGMYTANSMNCLTEVLGMGLQGNGTIPAVYSERIKLAKHAGMKVMEMYEKNIRPRDIMTEKAFLNALTVDMALGCSTNSMLHLPAIAHEAGVDLNMELVNEMSKRTPNLCHLAPAGPTYMEDLNEAGGVYAVMNELSKKNRNRQDRWREYQGLCQQESGGYPTDRQSVQPDWRYCDLERKPGTGYRRCKTFCRCTGDAGTSGTSACI